MSTCADCEFWKKGLRFPRDGTDEEHLAQTGICDNEEAFPRFWHDGALNSTAQISTWFDFPACRKFKPRADWAEKAAKRIFDGVMDSVAKSHPCLGYTKEAADEWKRTTAQAIREEAAKAGLK